MISEYLKQSILFIIQLGQTSIYETNVENKTTSGKQWNRLFLTHYVEEETDNEP